MKIRRYKYETNNFFGFGAEIRKRNWNSKVGFHLKGKLKIFKKKIEAIDLMTYHRKHKSKD